MKDGQTAEGAGLTSEIARRRKAALSEGAAGYQERRQEIIEAAGRVFKRKGYRATNLTDIATEAGTDRATLYYYISGKAELFDEVVSEVVEANAVLAESVRDSEQPAPEKLRAVIAALMASYADNFPYLYVFVQENLSHVAPERVEWSQRMRQLNHRYEDALIGILHDGIEEGTLIAAGPPQIMAYGLLGMLGWTNRWFNPHESPQSADQIAATFTAIYLRGVEVKGRRRPPQRNP